MLFNSYIFLFAFLPVVFAGYLIAGRIGRWVPVAWLSAASIFFYGYWNPPFLTLLLSSASFNFACGHFIGNATSDWRKRWVFRTGIAFNLILLCIFKYLGPSLGFLHDLGFSFVPIHNIVLPLGISFWTFTQIGYLVDRRDGLASDLKPLQYSFFVDFFPHLIAGPILHVREIGPQILNPLVSRMRASTFAPGLAIFAIGLAKKVLVADPLAPVVASGYESASSIDFANGWITILSYSMQLYFDFSGYSDMAIGLAGMLGFRFPLNFNSPYKSRTVIEYWQRWHMTLTRYLMLLLFNPMALFVTRRRIAQGKKVSAKAMRDPSAFFAILVVPTFYTFFLGGIWHGAGLQYVVFGLLQAVYISVNHGWRTFGPQRPKGHIPARWVVVASVMATYLAAIVSQTFFRSPSCSVALHLLAGAFGAHGLMLPYQWRVHFGSHLPSFLSFGPPPLQYELGLMLAAMLAVWTMPNSQQILGRFAPVLENVEEGGLKWLRWSPSLVCAFVTAIVLWLAIFSLNNATTFIYFQF
jgi:D-alanyl-lipoteichoic acid acyltransferase DltB (MBOAT superfamily)